MNISVLGCGRWGAFLAWYLGRMEQHNVLLYGRERSWRMAQLRETRKNDLLDLPARVTLTSDIHKAVDNSEILLISIGVQSVVGQDICQNWTTYLSKVSVLLESQNCTISFKKRPSLLRLQRGPLGYEVIPFLCPNQPCSAKRQSHQSAYPGQHYYTLRPRHAIAP